MWLKILPVKGRAKVNPISYEAPEIVKETIRSIYSVTKEEWDLEAESMACSAWIKITEKTIPDIDENLTDYWERVKEVVIRQFTRKT